MHSKSIVSHTDERSRARETDVALTVSVFPNKDVWSASWRIVGFRCLRVRIALPGESCSRHAQRLHRSVSCFFQLARVHERVKWRRKVSKLLWMSSFSLTEGYVSRWKGKLFFRSFAAIRASYNLDDRKIKNTKSWNPLKEVHTFNEFTLGR